MLTPTTYHDITGQLQPEDLALSTVPAGADLPFFPARTCRAKTCCTFNIRRTRRNLGKGHRADTSRVTGGAVVGRNDGGPGGRIEPGRVAHFCSVRRLTVNTPQLPNCGQILPALNGALATVEKHGGGMG